MLGSGGCPLHLLRSRLRAGAQVSKMRRGLGALRRVPCQRGVRGDHGVERRQVPPKRVVGGSRAEAAEGLRTCLSVRQRGGLHHLVTFNEGVDRRLALVQRLAQKIDAKRLVGLLRYILGGPLPEPLPGDRGDVPERLAVPLRLQDCAFRDAGPGRAPAAALRDVGGERRHTGGAARQSVDVLVGGDALGGVDRQCMTEAEQKTVRLLVAKPPPFDIGDVAPLCTDAQSIGALARTSTTSPLLPTCSPCPSTAPQVRRNSRTRSPIERPRS